MNSIVDYQRQIYFIIMNVYKENIKKFNIQLLSTLKIFLLITLNISGLLGAANY